MLTPRLFQKKLLTWFDQHGRKHLPWQKNKTPYRVWVSEIMLQQTQVTTVIPYYEKFMREFPDLNSIAKAPQDKVLHLWAGLGYYSRARHLHRAAQMIVDDYQGQFPDTLEGLKTLPGIGSSTAGAILSIAYQERAPILDGNVKRVLSRIYGITTPVNEKSTEAVLWEIATRNTPHQRVADYTQAIMDLGATFCTRRKPQCHTCPFTTHCFAHLNQLTESLPAKKATKKIPTKVATFLIFKNNQQIFLQKRPTSGIWGGLFSLPELPEEPTSKNIRDFCKTQFNVSIKTFSALKMFKHTFTHYHLLLHPVLIELKKIPPKLLETTTQVWYNPLHHLSMGLPKPIQTLLLEHHDTSHSLSEIKKRSRRLRKSPSSRTTR